MTLTTLDTVALVLGLVFAVRGAFKGFAWQAVRLVGLVAAAWAAFALQPQVGGWIATRVSFVPATVAPWVASVLIFATVFFAATLLAWTARGALREVHLGAPDRVLGFAFGALTGLVWLTLGFFLWGHFFASDQTIEDALRGSRSGPAMSWLVSTVVPHLPPEVRDRWHAVLEQLDRLPKP